MDWKIFSATFFAIFFAELADKTQLVGITMSAKTGKPIMVLLGSLAGYFLVTLISIIIGATLGKYIKPEYIKIAGAVIFIILGTLMLMDKI